MRFIVFLLVSFLFANTVLSSETFKDFKNIVYEVDGEKRTAALYVPLEYDSFNNWPLLVYLHGGGGGGDNEGNALNKWLANQPVTKEILKNPHRFNALVLIPRCPKGKVWAPVPKDTLQSNWREKKFAGEVRPDAADHITTAIDRVISTYSVNEKRISLTGFSMGGEGTIRYGALNHNRFAAIAPMAGSAIAIKDDVKALAGLKVWMFQGEKDNLSTAELGRKMSGWIREAGGEVQYTEFQGTGHGIPSMVFSTDGFVEWLIKAEKI